MRRLSALKAAGTKLAERSVGVLPLHFAVRKGHLSAVQLLVNEGTACSHGPVGLQQLGTATLLWQAQM